MCAMIDVTEKSRVSIGLVISLLILAFSAGGAWIKLSAHDTKLDDHEQRLRDHQERMQKAEDHYEAIHEWMQNHK